MGFLKTGAAAKQALASENAKTEARQAEAGKLWRFYIKKTDIGKDYKITFLDGHLDEEGTLEAPMWHEHMLQVGGDWKNLPCTAHEEPCPICALPKNEPALVAAFTVIDHTPVTIQSGPNAGKKLEHTRKLFVAKRTTYAMLQKLATKQGGLVGTTWEVSRSTEKSASVGELFQFEEKRTLQELKKLYGDNAEPANIAEEITYYNRRQLLQLGIAGSASVAGGNQPSEDLDAELGG